MPKFKQKLSGQRIVLKMNKPSILQAQILFRAVAANRSHLKPWFPWEKDEKKIEDAFKYLLETDQKIRKGDKADYGIYLGNDYIGNIGVFDINKERKSAEIGYWLSTEFVRKGYITEAVKLLETEFFTNQGLNRIQIKCDERNIASAGVAKKCGYIFEGKLREDSHSDFFNNFRNTLVFSKLKSDFKKGSKARGLTNKK